MDKLHRRSRLSALAVLVSIAGLVGACNDSHRSPTEPGPPASSMSAATAAARGGNGGGGGHGHPGADLSLQLQPAVWNTNWAHSQGTVSALVRGSDLDKIDLSSITLVGATGGTPVEPTRTQRTGNQVRVFFRQSDAIASLDHPKRGDVVEVQLELTISGESKTLTARVRIVGPNSGGGDDDGEETALQLEIQPNSWNTNWVRSSGQVTAVIRGTGLASIDLHSIVLVGSDDTATPLPATRAARSGNHVRAFFPMSDAFETLDDPKPGQTHEITIELSSKDGAKAKTELTDDIRVVGPRR
jgi:hypothetical protein